MGPHYRLGLVEQKRAEIRKGPIPGAELGRFLPGDNVEMIMEGLRILLADYRQGARQLNVEPGRGWLLMLEEKNELTCMWRADAGAKGV